MICPYYSQDEYPDVEVCRENRHDNLLSRGKYCRACASCGRDLGPKPKTTKLKEEDYERIFTGNVRERSHSQGQGNESSGSPTRDLAISRRPNAARNDFITTLNDGRGNGEPGRRYRSESKRALGSNHNQLPGIPTSRRCREISGVASPVCRTEKMSTNHQQLPGEDQRDDRPGRNIGHSNRYLSFMGGQICPTNDDHIPRRYNTHPNGQKLNTPKAGPEKPPKTRSCRNCKFPLRGNGAYCGICAPIRSLLKDDPDRLAEELAKVVYRRENGLTRKGHGFQPAPKKRGRPKGRNRHNEKRRGWPKGSPRHSIDWSEDMDKCIEECAL